MLYKYLSYSVSYVVKNMIEFGMLEIYIIPLMKDAEID